MSKKIALSASYFTCPPVAEILASCDTVYTGNEYALANFSHPDVRRKADYSPDTEATLLTY